MFKNAINHCKKPLHWLSPVIVMYLAIIPTVIGVNYVYTSCLAFVQGVHSSAAQIKHLEAKVLILEAKIQGQNQVAGSYVANTANPARFPLPVPISASKAMPPSIDVPESASSPKIKDDNDFFMESGDFVLLGDKAKSESPPKANVTLMQ